MNNEILIVTPTELWTELVKDKDLKLFVGEEERLYENQVGYLKDRPVVVTN